MSLWPLFAKMARERPLENFKMQARHVGLTYVYEICQVHLTPTDLEKSLLEP